MRRRRKKNLGWLVGGYVLGRGPLRTVRQLAGLLPALAVALMLVYVLAAAAWTAIGPLGRGLVALLVLGGVVVALLPAARAWLPEVAAPAVAGGPLPRTNAAWFSVYVISEWRDQNGHVLPRTLPGELPGQEARRHLVYVGKANDFDDRMEQHLRDKPWVHDHLMFSVIRCGSERGAFDMEAAYLGWAARSDRPEGWARENDKMNPHYLADAERRAWLLERARESACLRRAAVR